MTVSEFPRSADGEPRTDWNEAWKAARARSGRRSGRDVWDRRAAVFARAASGDGYVERMLALMGPEPSWSVLDVGSGAGTLAVPLARRVASVTALDYSARMIALLRERCAGEALTNVRPIVGAWEDDWEQLGIGACDVALASRSLSVHDLRAALVKLDRVARREVFVTAPVGAGPIDVRVLEAVGRPFVPGPDYVYPQAVLRELGIRARLTFLSVTHARRYASVADAIERLSWMIPDASASEVGRLRSWLERELVAAAGGLELPPRAQEWAVLSWCKAAAR